MGQEAYHCDATIRYSLIFCYSNLPNNLISKLYSTLTLNLPKSGIFNKKLKKICLCVSEKKNIGDFQLLYHDHDSCILSLTIIFLFVI